MTEVQVYTGEIYSLGSDAMKFVHRGFAILEELDVVYHTDAICSNSDDIIIKETGKLKDIVVEKVSELSMMPMTILYVDMEVSSVYSNMVIYDRPLILS